MSENRETFNYSYSAINKEEVEAIRKKYLVNDEIEPDKMEQLRKLDAKVTNKSSVRALCAGVISALIMGLGMSLIMTDLGASLGLVTSMILGTITGIVGMAGVIVAYPLYKCVLKRERKKAAPQILKLTEELSRR